MNNVVINVTQIVRTVSVNATPNLITITVNQSSGGAGVTQTLTQTLGYGRNTGGKNILVNNTDAIELENTSLLKKGTYNFGGNGGISRICSNNYEDMWQDGFRHVFDQSGFIRNSTNCFNIVPDASFDVTLRFKVGSIWTLDDGTSYICTDATEGVAVWGLYNSIPTNTSDLNNDSNFISDADYTHTDNNFTDILKTKLDGISDGAEVNVNADWNATSGDAQILNKPNLTGFGDMLKSTYDVDNTGVVDNAEAISIIGRNSTGSTLRKGTIIYISGSTGNRPNFVKAQANGEATSAGTLGVIKEDIANNTDGYCTTLGYLDNLDTRTTATYPFTSDTLADGDTIYLSPTTAGYITNVKPSAPNHLVYIGKVTRTSPTNGTIVYRIQNGYELNEIHDVAISSIADKQLLSYDNATGLWKNKSVTTADIADSTNKRYQTDNQNTFNDATSSIQTQLNGKQPSLGFTPYRYISSTASSTVTGTLTETQVLQVTIPANSFASLDLFKIPALKVFKTGIFGTAQIKIKLTTSNTMPSGTTSQIASFTTIAANLSIPMKRTFSVRSNVLSGYGNGSASSDEVVVNNPPSTFTFDPTVVNYLYVSITLSNTADSAFLDQFQLTNI